MSPILHWLVNVLVFSCVPLPPTLVQSFSCPLFFIIIIFFPRWLFISGAGCVHSLNLHSYTLITSLMGCGPLKIRVGDEGKICGGSVYGMQNSMRTVSVTAKTIVGHYMNI